MHNKLATAIALLLVTATFAVAAGQNTTSEQELWSSEEPAHVAVIDPSEIHEAILGGDAFELPTEDGPVRVEATDRVQPTITYDNLDEAGTVERAPNVWNLRSVDGQAGGLVLSFDHTLRAWVAGDERQTLVTPAVEHPGTSEDVFYRVADEDPRAGTTGSLTEDGFGTLSHIQVFRSVYAYVDTEYRDQYGTCCWADQIVWIIGLLNNYFEDVQLEYSFDAGTVDTDFDTHDLDEAWSTLINKPWNGADVRSYWSFKDFDGCDVGRATLPGWTFMIQHAPDACHMNERPSTDAERAYLTAREMGKNNDAHHNYHWSETTWWGHEHRSIMKDSLWGHYHECWSETNANRMASYLSTQVNGVPCEHQ